VENEAGRDGHFDDDFFVAGDAFDGDEYPAGADVEGGAEFEDGAAVGIGSVYKKGKRDGQTLPTSRLVLGFAHE